MGLIILVFMKNLKNSLIIGMMALLILSLFVGGVSAISGSGTAGNPYILTQPSDFSYLNDYPSAYFELGDDIDFGGSDYGEYCSDGFTGHFDGKEHVIYNINSAKVGFFKSIGSGATVKNVTFYKCSYNNFYGGILAQTISGSSLITIESVVFNDCSSVGYSTSTWYNEFVRGTICAYVDGDTDLLVKDCTAYKTKVSAFHAFTQNGYATSGGLIGLVRDSGADIELSGCLVSQSYIESMTYSSGLIGSLGSSSISSLNIHDCNVENSRIETPQSSANVGLICCANGLLHFGNANSAEQIQGTNVFITDNTVYNCYISGARFSAGISVYSTAGYLHVTYDGNLVQKCTITQTTNSWYQGQNYMYAGGFNAIATNPYFPSEYNNNAVEYCVVYAEKSLSTQYGNIYRGYASIFMPQELTFNSFTNNHVYQTDVGSGTDGIKYKTLPSISHGNFVENIDEISGKFVRLIGIEVSSDSENPKSKTFVAVQVGAVLVNDANSNGVIPQYVWNYDSDSGASDVTTETYYSTYTYPTDGEYHATLTVQLFSRTTDTTSKDLSTIYLGIPTFVEGANILKTKDLQTFGQNVRFTANMIQGYGGETYSWYQSVNNGAWELIVDESIYSYSDITYTSTGDNTVLVKYKCVAENIYGSTTSDVLSFLWTPSQNVEDVVTALSISSETDTYSIDYSVKTPFEALKVDSLGSEYTILTTKNAIYLLKNNAGGVEGVIKDKINNFDSYIYNSKAYEGIIVYYTDANKAFITSVSDSLEFSVPIELPILGDNIAQVEISSTGCLIRSTTSSNEYIQVYSLITGELQYTIYQSQAFTFSNWRLNSATNDNSGRNVAFCTYNAGDEKFVRCYVTGDIYYDSNTFNANTITQVVPFEQTCKLALATQNGRSYLISYECTQNAFRWNNVLPVEDITLTNLHTTYYDIRFAGINAPNNVVFISSSSGAIESTYPTSTALTAIDLAKTTGLYAITGDYDGRSNIIFYNTGTWRGLQSYSIGQPIVDVTIADGGMSISSTSRYETYLGYNQNVIPVDDSTVLVTKYYLNVLVYNADGTPAVNSPVTIIGAEGSTSSLTGSDGSTTLEVYPAKMYTIQANGQTRSYVATTNAWQQIFFYSESTNPYIGLSNNCVYNESSGLITFTFNAEENYAINLKFVTKNGITLVNENYNGNSYTYSFDTSDFPSQKNIIVKLDATATQSGHHLTNAWAYTVIERTSTGVGIFGTLPFVPEELDQKWISFLFGGLIMLVGGLFGYLHSAKGCLITVIFAAVLTWMGVLPLHPIWIGCMVVIGILAVYAWSSQREGS